MACVALILTTFLTGCAGAGSREVVVTPDLVDYTAAEQRRLADELEPLPRDGMIWRVVTDYVRMRDQIRTARGG